MALHVLSSTCGVTPSLHQGAARERKWDQNTTRWDSNVSLWLELHPAHWTLSWMACCNKNPPCPVLSTIFSVFSKDLKWGCPLWLLYVLAGTWSPCGAGAQGAQRAPSLVRVGALGKLLGIEGAFVACRSPWSRPYDSPGPPSGGPHLGKHVWVGVILQKHRSCPRVIVAGGDVQGREAHLASRPIVDEVCHDVLVTLLQSHGQGSEAVLARGEEARSIYSGCT